MWTGIIDNLLIDPNVIQNKLNGNNYLIYLQEILSIFSLAVGKGNDAR